MIYLAIAIISLFFLLASNIAYGITASEFVSKFGYSLDSGQKVEALITVSGEPQSTDPLKRAKEIRYLQSGVLKFAIFAGAINVKSDTWDNQFQAEITTSLLEVLKNRKDVLSVEIISQLGNTDTITENFDATKQDYLQEKSEFLESVFKPTKMPEQIEIPNESESQDEPTMELKDEKRAMGLERETMTTEMQEKSGNSEEGGFLIFFIIIIIGGIAASVYFVRRKKQVA